jgi:hypothetical protein
VPGANRTRHHLTSRPPGHRVPDLCDHPRSSASGLLLLPWSSSLHAMTHMPPAHHETSKHDSLNETKVKEKQNEIIPDSNSNLAKSMTHHNQTKELTTWFLRNTLQLQQKSLRLIGWVPIGWMRCLKSYGQSLTWILRIHLHRRLRSSFSSWKLRRSCYMDTRKWPCSLLWLGSWLLSPSSSPPTTATISF